MSLQKRVPRQEDAVCGLEEYLDCVPSPPACCRCCQEPSVIYESSLLVHQSNREASAPPEVSAGGQVPSLPFGAGAGPGAGSRESLEEV